MKLKNLILIGLIVPNILLANFTVRGEVVYDNQTELYWQSNPSNKKFNWSSAKNYCSNLNYGDKKNWRLPTIDELKSLVDYGKHPAIVTKFISIKEDDHYWASSKYVYVHDSSTFWIIDFDFGNIHWEEKSNNNYVLCVK